MPVLAKNKKALHDYEIIEKYEAGIVLTGSEVKSVRSGNVSLKGAFVTMHISGKGTEFSLINCHIEPYPMAGPHQHETERSRKLLLNRREIASIIGKTQQKGLTLVPLTLYTKGSRIKLEFALVRGKKQYEKREVIRKRETEREIRRYIKVDSQNRK
jgi:SsrA-binding protein